MPNVIISTDIPRTPLHNAANNKTTSNRKTTILLFKIGILSGLWIYGLAKMDINLHIVCTSVKTKQNAFSFRVRTP